MMRFFLFSGFVFVCNSLYCADSVAYSYLSDAHKIAVPFFTDPENRENITKAAYLSGKAHTIHFDNDKQILTVGVGPKTYKATLGIEKLHLREWLPNDTHSGDDEYKAWRQGRVHSFDFKKSLEHKSMAEYIQESSNRQPTSPLTIMLFPAKEQIMHITKVEVKSEQPTVRKCSYNLRSDSTTSLEFTSYTPVVNSKGKVVLTQTGKSIRGKRKSVTQ